MSGSDKDCQPAAIRPGKRPHPASLSLTQTLSQKKTLPAAGLTGVKLEGPQAWPWGVAADGLIGVHGLLRPGDGFTTTHNEKTRPRIRSGDVVHQSQCYFLAS